MKEGFAFLLRSGVPNNNKIMSLKSKTIIVYGKHFRGFTITLNKLETVQMYANPGTLSDTT